MNDADEVATRLATPDDALTVTRVHERSRAAYYGDALDPEDARRDRQPMWRRILSDSSKRTTVAASGNEIVGFVTVTAAADAVSNVELSSLYVLPSFMGSGVAQRLYDVFVAELRSNHAQLEVSDGNDRAKAFYSRRGWKPTQETRPGVGGRPFVTWHLTQGGC